MESVEDRVSSARGAAPNRPATSSRSAGGGCGATGASSGTDVLLTRRGPPASSITSPTTRSSPSRVEAVAAGQHYCKLCCCPRTISGAMCTLCPECLHPCIGFRLRRRSPGLPPSCHLSLRRDVSSSFIVLWTGTATLFSFCISRLLVGLVGSIIFISCHGGVVVLELPLRYSWLVC